MLYLIGVVINVVLLLWLSRRLLGVPVGWGRTALMLLVINSLQYAIPSEFLEELFDLPLLQVLLILTLASGWLVTFQLVILTVLEALIPTSSVPNLTVFLREIPARWRQFRRMTVIWWIVTKNGLAAFFSPTDTTRHVRDTSRISRSFRKALTDAGVTFIKFGQMLSTRADLLPDGLVRELSSLQSEVPPEAWDTIEPQISASLPRPLQEVFRQFDHEPLAAASVAQVHAARLADGTGVVVKVQRPRAQAQAQADLEILRTLAGRLQRGSNWARRLGVAKLAEGFAASLKEELDYRVEAVNMAAIAHGGSGIRVPHVYRELSSERLLVMERIDGQPLSRAADMVASMPPERRVELARQLFEAVMHQVLISGVFHADLHPGNIIVTADGLALLDFGSVGRLDKPSRQSLGLLLRAIDGEDALNTTDALITLLDRPVDLDDRALQREVGQLILRFGGGGEETSAMFAELMALVVRHGFTVPPQLAAAFRALGALEGSLRLIDPHLDMVSLAQGMSGQLSAAYTSPHAVKDAVNEQLMTLLPMLQRLPRQISRVTEQLEEGSLAVTVKGLSTVADDGYLRPLVQQITLSILAAALGLAGVAMLAIPGPPLVPFLTVWAYLGLWLLAVAFVLGTRVLTGIFAHDRS